MSTSMKVSFSLLLSVAVAGCGGQSALEARAQQFAYTSESLSKELISRLEKVHPDSGKSSGKDAKKSPDMDADRGSDGDRPDPNSIKAIVMDAAVKIQGVGQQEGGEDALTQVLENVSNAETVPEPVREEFTTALVQALATVKD